MTVEWISSGQFGDHGCRVTPPFASEKDTMNTSLCGALISR
jgi:hypothetical protein